MRSFINMALRAGALAWRRACLIQVRHDTRCNAESESLVGQGIQSMGSQGGWLNSLPRSETDRNGGQLSIGNGDVEVVDIHCPVARQWAPEQTNASACSFPG